MFHRPLIKICFATILGMRGKFLFFFHVMLFWVVKSLLYITHIYNVLLHCLYIQQSCPKSSSVLFYLLLFFLAVSCTLLFSPFLSFSLLFFPFLSFSLLFSPFLSFSLLFSPFLSFSLLFFPFLSFSLLFSPFLSFSLLFPNLCLLQEEQLYVRKP